MIVRVFNINYFRISLLSVFLHLSAYHSRDPHFGRFENIPIHSHLIAVSSTALSPRFPMPVIAAGWGSFLRVPEAAPSAFPSLPPGSREDDGPRLSNRVQTCPVRRLEKRVDLRANQIPIGSAQVHGVPRGRDRLPGVLLYSPECETNETWGWSTNGCVCRGDNP